MTPPVVKLGGSLLADASLDALVAVAARRGAVVVAGGGRFADAVRAEQKRLGFGDGAAHAMAILAMEQTARLIAARFPDLVACASLDDLATAPGAGRGAIWLPYAMALAAPLAASWDVTSDSLALWLAIELRAETLTLLKSAPCPQIAEPADLARAGIVDPAFPRLATRFSGRIACLGPATPAALDAALGASAHVAA